MLFDLETTGINIANDRIVEIAIVKRLPEGRTEEQRWLVNPECPIPAEATAVHGITNEQVADAPTFKDLAPTIRDFIKDCDLAGYNSDRFDIPLLAEELSPRRHGHLILKTSKLSMCKPFSIKWNSAPCLPPINFIVKKNSIMLIRPWPIPKPHTRC